MKTNRLLEKQVIETYASLLLEVAQGEKRVVEDLKQLEFAHDIIAEHAQLREAIESRMLPAKSRHALIEDVFQGSVSPEVKDVLAIMAERRDTDYIKRVADVYRKMAEDKLNLIITEVTTAVPMDDELRARVTDQLSKQFGKAVHLEEVVDPSIMGGVIVNAQGKRMDASIATQLAHARNVLSKTVSTGGDA